MRIDQMPLSLLKILVTPKVRKLLSMKLAAANGAPAKISCKKLTSSNQYEAREQLRELNLEPLGNKHSFRDAPW